MNFGEIVIYLIHNQLFQIQLVLFFFVLKNIFVITFLLGLRNCYTSSNQLQVLIIKKKSKYLIVLSKSNNELFV